MNVRTVTQSAALPPHFAEALGRPQESPVVAVSGGSVEGRLATLHAPRASPADVGDRAFLGLTSYWLVREG